MCGERYDKGRKHTTIIACLSWAPIQLFGCQAVLSNVQSARGCNTGPASTATTAIADASGSIDVWRNAMQRNRNLHGVRTSCSMRV